MNEKVGGEGSIAIEEALRGASFRLRQAGLEQPRAEAELLLMHLLGWDRLKLFLQRDGLLGGDVTPVFRAVVERRAGGEPLAYITGTRDFYGLTFRVNRNVLIPRPETELLVDAALGWARAPRGELQGVDLGCGCGALAVTLTHHLPGAFFHAVDLSPEALQVAEDNARRHGVGDRIRFLEGDFLDAFAAMEAPPLFNLVVSNPPYLSRTELAGLPATIRDHEPPLALDGGRDGLDAYRSILASLPRFMRGPGLMVLEMGASQGGALLALCRQQPLFRELFLQRDYRDLPRVLVGLF